MRRALRARALFSVFSVFSVFVFCFAGFSVPASGARGLIKAPAGDRGLAPGRELISGLPVYFIGLLAPTFTGGLGGYSTSILLDLLVLTDTVRGQL